MSTPGMMGLDFEFNRSIHPIVNLVSCVTNRDDGKEIIEWWLHKDIKRQDELKAYLLKHRNDIFLGFSDVAECRSFMALGLDPVQFKWLDLFLEYRCISNHNYKICIGSQYVDGKVKYIKEPKPKWERIEGEKANGFRQTHSLVEATYKLTGEKRDSEHKDKMRALIISDPKEFTIDQIKDILRYNNEDVAHLFKMLNKTLEEFRRLLGPNFNKDELMLEMLLRGEYAALTAIRESRGYPINNQEVRYFSQSIDLIIQSCQREINSFFPDIKPFKWVKKDSRFSWNQIATKAWLKENVDIKHWMKTDSKDLSLALEAWQKVFDFKHSYPEDNFGAQMVRYLTLKQNLNGFKSKADKGKKTFWDYVGPDGRVHPYMNIYGAGTSRSQPSATGFMFLKPAWMRCMVQPPKGKMLIYEDYGSEEFFLSALMSGDQNMIDAYLSGDVYLYFAKLAGAVPWEGKREDYEALRDLFKATTLGISYLMTKYGLAVKLTNDTGIPHNTDQAQELIDKFYNAFPVFAKWQDDLIQSYMEGNPIKLPCGWYQWCDNANFRSSANAPIQGFGGSIMRKADKLCYDAGLYIPFTLHDALTGEADLNDWSAVDKQYTAMKEAFIYYFRNDPHKYEMAKNIKIDITVWSPEFEEGKVIITPDGHKIKLKTKYIDKRAKEYYDKYKYYLETNIFDL